MEATENVGPKPQADALPVDLPHGAAVRSILGTVSEEFPYTPKFHRFQNALGAYIDEGPRDAPVLLCVHGNPTWSFFYRALIREYSDRMRVVVPDHIGMGLSEKPKDFEYTLQNRILGLKDLVETLDLKRITLVAHDWGGAIGLGLAGRAPERFARLVLSNTAAFPGLQAHTLIRIARLPGLHQLLMGRMGLFEKITVKHATRKELTPLVKRAYLAPFPNAAARVAVQNFVKDIPLQKSHRSRRTLEEVEASLTCLQQLPALLLWGEKDWVFHGGFREQFQQRLPLAEAHSLADAGHLLWEDDPQACLEAVSAFLERHPL